jgi:hypothetical protein
MVECDIKARKWGNSLGLVIPKDIVEKENIQENEDLHVLILKKKKNPLRETFGSMKNEWKMSGQEIKDILRKELHQIE